MDRCTRNLIIAFVIGAVAAAQPLLAATRPLVTLTNDAANVPANIMVPLAGIGAMIAYNLPPIDNNGSPNQARQDNAVRAAVSAAVARGLIPPANTSCPANAKTSCYLLSDYQDFALAYARKNNAYVDVRPRVTVITYIQWFLAGDRNPDGTINWSNCSAKCVDGDIADLVNLAFEHSLGAFVMSGSANSQNLIAFVKDLAHIIDTYNTSGG